MKKLISFIMLLLSLFSCSEDKNFQEIKHDEAFWLIETLKDGSKKEHGYHSIAKFRIDDTREYCKKLMNNNLNIIRIDIINAYNDINYIERK